eukprot:1111341-Amphidinium_carterae.1
MQASGRDRGGAPTNTAAEHLEFRTQQQLVSADSAATCASRSCLVRTVHGRCGASRSFTTKWRASA